MKPTIKKLKSTFDELSAKYKKGNAHTKSRQNRNVYVGGEPSSMSGGSSVFCRKLEALEVAR
jgi:hypothetical protein